VIIYWAVCLVWLRCDRFSYVTMFCWSSEAVLVRLTCRRRTVIHIVLRHIKATFTLIRVTCPGFGLRLVQASPVRMGRSWSLHQPTHLNACLPTISSRPKIESREWFAEKVTIYHYIVNNSTNRAPLSMNN